jgi:hypothetical protein
MTTIINAATSGGLIQTADTSGVLALQTAGTTALSISAAQVVTVTNDASISGLTVGKGGGAVGASTAIGFNALNANTTGENTAVGYTSLPANTTGEFNTAVGRNSMLSNTTGNNNVAVGRQSLNTNTTGGANVAIGTQSLLSNTTASNNTAVGYRAGYTNTTGTQNVYLGNQAGEASNANYNTFVGYQTGITATGGFNTFLGYAAGYSMTTGTKNTIIGVYNGNQGGLDIRTSSNYIVLSDGDGNPRGVFNNNGTFFIGAFTSPNGTQRLVLTADGNAGTEPMLFNELRTSSATENYVRFYRNGNQVGSITNTLSATAYVTSSDYRLKENIAPMTGALATVAQLKPVTYKWKATGENGQGFIAHELQALVPDCVSGEKDAVDENGNPEYQGIDTSFLVATLTAAIQELNAKVEAQAARIAALEGAQQ